MLAGAQVSFVGSMMLLSNLFMFDMFDLALKRVCTS